MATALYTLGRLAYRRRRTVLAVWLVLLAGMAAAGTTLRGPTTDSTTMPGTESQRAIDLLEQRLPQASGASGRIVFAAPGRERVTVGKPAAAVTAATAAVRRVPGVRSVSAPTASKDRRIALAQVTWAQATADLPDGSVDAVRDAAAQAARGAGLQVEFGGEAFALETTVDGTGEVIGLAVAGLVLLITFGSLVAAGLPLLTALIGVAIGVLGITAATGVVELDSAVSTVALMLGLAVGIDYALFIGSRHRAQLFAGMDPEESAARAVGTAGSAVVFAGATVVIALASLAIVGIPFLTAMGLAAAGTVAVAVAVSLTLVPALLGFAGARMATGKNPESRGAAAPTIGARWVALLTRRRVPAVVVSVLVLGPLSIPVLDMRLGEADDSTAPPQDTNRKAYDLLVDGFGPGSGGPLLLVVDAGERGAARRAADVVAAEFGQLDDVAGVDAPVTNDAGTTAVVSLTPRSGPSAPATRDLVERIRDRTDTLDREIGARVLVTGQTAANIDFADRLSSALVPYLAMIVGLAFVLMTVAFRSVLVPLSAVGGFLLTIGATFGALVAVFQRGTLAGLFGVQETAPISALLPIFIVGILFGLAMDYQVFLVSRMREEHVHGASPTHAVTEGFRHGARVVTAAALIMGGVFAGFVVEDQALIKAMGFALAFGILVDAFLVRMTLIPALLALLGARAWWLPRWLDRLLPRVDIEGEQLRTRLAGAERAVEASATGGVA